MSTEPKKQQLPLPSGMEIKSLFVNEFYLLRLSLHVSLLGFRRRISFFVFSCTYDWANHGFLYICPPQREKTTQPSQWKSMTSETLVLPLKSEGAWGKRYEWRNFQWFMERPCLCLCPKSPIASHQSNVKNEFGDKSEKCDGRARKLTPVLTSEFSDCLFSPSLPQTHADCHLMNPAGVTSHLEAQSLWVGKQSNKPLPGLLSYPDDLRISYHTLIFLATNLLTVNTETNKDAGLGRSSPGRKEISGVGNNQKSGFHQLGFHMRAGTMIWVRAGGITLDDYLGTLASFGDE